MWYIIDGRLTNFFFSELIGSIDQNAWNTKIEGNVTIRFYAKDITDKIASTEVIVIKEPPEQPRQPTQPINVGYNILLLISIISGTLFLLIIKKRVKLYRNIS